MLLPTVCCLLVAAALAGPAQRASTLQTKTLDHWATLDEDTFSHLKSMVPAADLSALNFDATSRTLIGAPGAYTLDPGLYFLKSPNFPFRYPNDYDETWELDATDGQDITIKCWYTIQFSSGCSADFLEINGDDRCGWGYIKVTSDELEITFTTDASVRRRGFFCAVTVPVAL